MFIFPYALLYVQMPPPVYGHVGFPIKAPFSRTPGPVCDSMVIFGGSLNAQSAAASSLHGLFMYEVGKHRWTKVVTGYAFPSYRTGHAAAVIEGWAPDNYLPGDQHGDVEDYRERRVDWSIVEQSKPMDSEPIDDVECRRSLLMYGGINSVSQVIDFIRS